MGLNPSRRAAVTTDRDAGPHDVTEGAPELPTPIRPAVPAWFWSTVVVVIALGCAAGWALSGGSPLLWGLVPYTIIGNSLAMIPYDWYLPAFVQQHGALTGIVIATAATVLVEYWNMDVLARLLSREGTAAFRGHTVTARFLAWYRKAPWWTLVVAGFAPVIPFYPCRFLATLARYPMWRYQAAIVVGRAVRYAVLAGAGLLLFIPPLAYFVVGALMLAVFAIKYLQHRRRPSPA